MRAADLIDADPLDLALMRGYPAIRWLEPLSVIREDGAHGWACRICIGRYGLRAQDIAALFHTDGEVRGHIVAFHRLNPDG